MTLLPPLSQWQGPWRHLGAYPGFIHPPLFRFGVPSAGFMLGSVSTRRAVILYRQLL